MSTARAQASVRWSMDPTSSVGSASARERGNANLVRHPKGQLPPMLAGATRKPRVPIVDLVERELEKLAREEGIPREEAASIVARAWLQTIRKGDTRALKEYLDRRDGPVQQRVAVSADVPAMLAALWRDVEADSELANSGPPAIAESVPDDTYRTLSDVDNVSLESTSAYDDGAVPGDALASMPKERESHASDENMGPIQTRAPEVGAPTPHTPGPKIISDAGKAD